MRSTVNEGLFHTTEEMKSKKRSEMEKEREDWSVQWEESIQGMRTGNVPCEMKKEEEIEQVEARMAVEKRKRGRGGYDRDTLLQLHHYSLTYKVKREDNCKDEDVFGRSSLPYSVLTHSKSPLPLLCLIVRHSDTKRE